MQNGATPENEVQLIQAFKEGKDDALRMILDLFHKNIVFFAKRNIGNQPDSEKIASDIFMKLFKSHADFEKIANIKAFLYISTRNACIDLIRKKKIAANWLGVVVSLSEDGLARNISESASDEPFWSTIQMELIRKIIAQVETLPFLRRYIFEMHYYENKSVSEIANELQITQASVLVQLTIAKSGLSQQIFETVSPNTIPIETQYLYDSNILKEAKTKIEILRFSPSFGILQKILKKGLKIDDLNWREFEKLVAQLLESDGFNIELMQGTKDGGVDIVATKLHDISGYYKTLWQAKKYSKNKVTLNTIRELADSVNEFKASKGIIVTSTYLTKDALYRVMRDKYILSKVDRIDLDNWINRVLWR